MIYLFEILLLIANIAMADYHAHLIKQQRPIKHGWWGLLYVAVTIAFAFICQSWVLLIVAALLRKVVFDIALNLFRSLPVFYVSSSTTSIIDRVHNYIFGKHSEIYLSIYFLVIIFLNIFLL